MRNSCWFLLRNYTALIALAACSVFFAGCGDPMEWPSYTVVYDANGGDGIMVSSVIRHGVSQQLNANAFTKVGHGFDGWSMSPNGAVEFSDRQSVANLSRTDGAVVTLYAAWRAYSFTVVYDANGGIGEMEDSVFRFGGEGLYLSSNAFTHAFGVFLGWSRLPDGHVEFRDGAGVGNLVFGDGEVIRLYARWGSGVFTVTFHANEGKGSVPEPQDVSAGSAITLPSGSGLPESGYVFVGWNTEADGRGTGFSAGDVYTPHRSITLYAQWTIIFTVTFDANGGIGTVPAPMPTSAGVSVTLPGGGGLSRSGFNFAGWNTTPDGDGDNFSAGAEYTPTGNVTLYARWAFDGIVITGEATLSQKLDWLRINARSGLNYLVEVNRDETLSSAQAALPSGVSNVSITLRGMGGPRTIIPSDNRYLFTVGSGITLVLDNNIILQGGHGNNLLVSVGWQGTLIMNHGAKITGGHGVNVSVGTFVMNDGKIFENTGPASVGGGVNMDGGLFVMNGGEIFGNTGDDGGGVRLNSGGHSGHSVMIMNGGTIAGNTARRSGGGVFVGSRSHFHMRGGTIAGNSTLTGRGGGVFVGNSEAFRISDGIIHGSDAGLDFMNTAGDGAALFSSGTAQRGTFTTDCFFSPGGIFNATCFAPLGTLFTTNDTVRIVNGVLQQ